MNSTGNNSEPQILLPMDYVLALSPPEWALYPLGFLYEFFEEVVDSVTTLFLVGTFIVLLYLLFGLVTYVLLSSTAEDEPRRRVMFITAHPDDEVMFFGPTIIRLRDTCDIHLLCLSTGNMYGKGKERKKELWASCKILGIPDSNITLFSHSGFPDDAKVMWSAKKVYAVLMTYIYTYDIEEVFTFDVEGVSGHLNHISIFYGFARMCLMRNTIPNCRVFLLESVNKIRKYNAYFDTLASLFPLFDRLYVVSWGEAMILRKAMRAHKSQMVWYRTLYLYFSRYMYVNSYRELNLDDVLVILDMNEFNHGHQY